MTACPTPNDATPNDARAEARRARGVTVERMTSLDETTAPYAEATVDA